tara:strand:- start:613 stop:1167 length:555 start_codon:yes stop_codon:yes gene_type:complete
MKIYTKNGDKGMTSIIGEKGLCKHDERIDAYGTVDELNTYLGLVRSFPFVKKTIYNDVIIDLQKKLFKLGSYLAQSNYKSIANKNILITKSDIVGIESHIDIISKELPVLKSFVLNGGEIISSHIQISRTICRRAERKLTIVNEKYQIDSIWLIFINRLSDFLFVLGRYFLNKSGENELYWKGL